MRKTILFLLLMIALDRIVGAALDRLYRGTMAGEAGGLINLALQKDADILVFGSSRAKQHIVPAILGSRLSATVFNAGVNGQEFLYSAILLDLWKREHKAPKAIVLHVDPTSFIRMEDEIQKTSVFSAFYDRSERVREIVAMRGKYERLKYLSYSYRFNGKVLPILKNFLQRPDIAFDGYESLGGASDLSWWTTALANPKESQGPFSDVKLRLLDDIAKWSRENGTKLFLVHSPYWRSDPVAMQTWLARMATLSAPYPGVEFINISEQSHPEVFSRPDLFRDGNHLNAKGARIFSSLLADELARRMPAINPALTTSVDAVRPRRTTANF
jgi:hypothetical protein